MINFIVLKYGGIISNINYNIINHDPVQYKYTQPELRIT
jgi:hypothetical protein